MASTLGSRATLPRKLRPRSSIRSQTGSIFAVRPIIGFCRAPTNHGNPRGTIISCQFGASLCRRGVLE
jgi:hypothetical protein